MSCRHPVGRCVEQGIKPWLDSMVSWKLPAIIPTGLLVEITRESAIDRKVRIIYLVGIAL